jgi:signal transduction histidine kinase
VIVGDTGVGIEPDQQERIFEAFYRAKGHTASNDHGAGLGLALARWLVSAHDGDISVKSTPGEGSVFTVSLPLRADRHTPADTDGAEAPLDPAEDEYAVEAGAE